MNNWNIPNDLEKIIKDRDKDCVYCRRQFSLIDKRGNPSWEHIINDARIVAYENIAICCRSCNSSKGARDLFIWLKSRYCQKKNITQDTVAEIVKRFINNVNIMNKKTI